MPLGGANPSNYIPGYNTPRSGGGNSRGGGANNTAPFTKGNSTPSGKGSGTWVSGQHSSRSDRTNRGGSSGSGNRKRGAGRKNRSPRSRSNKGAATRGNTATSRGLGGSGIPGATPAGAAGTFPKGGIYGLGAYIFFRILFGNQELSDGTLPEHLRQPGETQVTELGKPPFYGGQSYEKYYAWGTYTSQSNVITKHRCGEQAYWATETDHPVPGKVISVELIQETTRLKFVSQDINGKKSEYFRNCFYLSNPDDERPSNKAISYKTSCIDKATIYAGNNFVITGLLRIDGQPDTEGNPPPSDSGTTSASTTNHGNAGVAPRGEGFPPGIRPAFPSDRTANPTPSSGFKKPSSKNYSGKLEKPPAVSRANNNPPPSVLDRDDKRARVELPSAKFTPAPEPPPPKGETSLDNPEAGETFKFGKQKTDEEEEVESEAESEPNIISVTKTKRADGTTVVTTTREATPEEMRDYDRTVEKAKKINEADRRFRFGDNYDGGIDTDTDIGSPPEKNKNEVEEEERISPAKINNKVNPVPPETDDDTVKPPSEPDEPDTPPFVPPPPVSQNPTTECKGCSKKILDKLGGLNTVLQGTDLLLVQQIHSTVHHPEHGLAKIQDFAKTAWKAVQGDKVMSGITMALTVHNAMMLSNNLASTVSEAVNMSFNALNIRNEEDEEIDIGNAIRTKITEVLSSALGAENYAALTARIAKANRIYQASINLLDTTYSLFDSARTVAELTAENTGKIGNALREAGAVYEDAYEEMTEKINPQNTAMRKLGSFRDTIEVASDAFDSVTEISSNIVEIKETVGQIETEKQNLKTEIDGFIKEQKDEKDTAKTQNQVTTDISDNDFDRGTEES